MNIDIEKLRQDLIHYFLGGYFVGGIGPFSLEASDLYDASDEEVIQIAIENHFNLNKYIIEDDEKSFYA